MSIINRYVMKLLRKSGLVVTIATAIAILYLRSIHSVYFGAGTTLTTVIAKGLKLCIRQQRPPESTKAVRRLNYGMPSTHSSAIAFMGTYLTGILIISDSFTPWQRVIGTIASAYIATSVAWSRVRLGHHTSAQVSAGASLGTVMALILLRVWTGPSMSLAQIATRKIVEQHVDNSTCDIKQILEFVGTLSPEQILFDTGLKEPAQTIQRACLALFRVE